MQNPAFVPRLHARLSTKIRKTHKVLTHKQLTQANVLSPIRYIATGAVAVCYSGEYGDVEV